MLITCYQALILALCWRVQGGQGALDSSPPFTPEQPRGSAGLAAASIGLGRGGQLCVDHCASMDELNASLVMKPSRMQECVIGLCRSNCLPMNFTAVLVQQCTMVAPVACVKAFACCSSSATTCVQLLELYSSCTSHCQSVEATPRAVSPVQAVCSIAVVLVGLQSTLPAQADCTASMCAFRFQ
jgi:hypothetical protein